MLLEPAPSEKWMSFIKQYASKSPDDWLPAALIKATKQEKVAQCLEQSLFEPVRDITRRPSKQIRRDLVKLGFEAASSILGDTPLAVKNLKAAEEIVETLHAGSLIVDDIEDNSTVRRGGPSIHRLYGMPVALNAAHWLYFWPLRIIDQMDLPAKDERLLYRYYQRTVLQAHLGQAIDIGLEIDRIAQPEVQEASLLAMELKTGALTGFAVITGAILAGLGEELMGALNQFGRGFGITLQMFDDLGNLFKTKGAKQFEDLALRRPSWVWACAADYPHPVYREFVMASQKLPDRSDLETWLDRTEFIDRARAKAHGYVMKFSSELESEMVPRGANPKVLAKLQDAILAVEKAYS